MTSKLIPSNPSEVMVIRKVTPNITTCSVPFNRFGHFKVGGRGTIGMIAHPHLREIIPLIFHLASSPPVWGSRSLLSRGPYPRGPYHRRGSRQ